MRELTATTLQGLTALADRADAETNFPSASWELMRAAGVPAWSVPAEFGGQGLSASAPARRRTAGGRLPDDDVPSQPARGGRSPHSHARPAGGSGRSAAPAGADEIFVTVGLSQLTTSRQHQAPALAAAPAETATFSTA